jgi:hypothetical protein
MGRPLGQSISMPMKRHLSGNSSIKQSDAAAVMEVTYTSLEDLISRVEIYKGRYVWSNSNLKPCSPSSRSNF